MARRQISGFSNPTVKHLRSLRDKKHRRRERKFLAEGLRLLTDAREAGRLPELFAGLARDDFPTVVPYPTSCSPQAWAAATPLAFLRSILRLDPWMPHGQVWIAPRLLPGMTELRVDNIALGDGRVSVIVDDEGVKVEGVPDGIDVVYEPRNPLTAQT